MKDWDRGFTYGGTETTKHIMNRLIVAVSFTAIAVVLGSRAGYSLVRFRFRSIK